MISKGTEFLILAALCAVCTAESHPATHLEGSQLAQRLAARRLLASSKQAAPAQKASQNATVIVVGAGVAGLAAAKRLSDQGISVIVLEGRNRTGGRMYTVPASGGLFLDFGCSWIHGINGSSDGMLSSNPIWDIAVAAGVVTGSTGSAEDLVARGLQGEVDLTNATKLVDQFDANVTEAEAAAPSGSDKSLGALKDEFIAKDPSLAQNSSLRLAFDATVYAHFENDQAANAANISGYFGATDEHFYGPEVVFKNGYQQISDYLARGLDIRLGATVTEVAHDEDGVTVTTADGSNFTASYVIVTVPLGVLKKKAITFSPPPPTWKQQAIDLVGWGLMDKAYFVFDSAFWPDDSYFIIRVSPAVGEWVLWVNLHKVFGSPVIACLNTGSAAERLQKLSDAEVFAEGLAVLREMYGNATVPEPRESLRTNWGLDPFAWGAYSFPAVNQGDHAFNDLSFPVADRILWAGEATSPPFFGYTHGALLSGRREAERLIFSYGLAPAYVGSGNAAASGRRTPSA
ncbi:g6829 [Coccomyxa elongata]